MTDNRPIALVTGASSGIGAASSRALVDAGFEVYGTSRDASKLSPTTGIHYLDLDVKSDESVDSAVAAVIARSGRIDLLVNNAGIGTAGAAEESSADQAQDVFDTNLFGVIRVTNAVLPHMRAQESGRIVNISSIVGFIPQPFMAVYAASKHALEGYSESIDHELRQHGVRVLLVEPAWTTTEFGANSLAPDAPLPVYEKQREVFSAYVADSIKGGDDPALVAKAVVEAATDSKPKLRYPVGPRTGRVHTMRRLVPTRMFDQQLRKLNGLPA